MIKIDELFKASKSLKEMESELCLDTDFINGAKCKFDSAKQISIILEVEEFISVTHGVDIDLFEFVSEQITRDVSFLDLMKKINDSVEY